ncbi:hypothetical protein UlMin_029811 [Ulmus minor]
MPLKPTPATLNQIHAQIIKNPQPKTLNSFLRSLSNSNPQNALLLYNQMLLHPTSHNHYTFTFALKASSSLNSHPKGLEIHAHLLKSGHFSDIFIQNSLLHFYVSRNDLVSATQFFDSICNPNVVSWTSIISGLSKSGFEEEAIVKFASMDVEPNYVTLVSVMSACTCLRALRFGKAVHGYSLRNLSENNIVLDNVILDFYARFGSLGIARHLFVKMPKRDGFSWSTLVGGYAHRGLCEEAVGVFLEMVEQKEADPDEATLVNVLSACSSIGALSLGRWVHSYISSRSNLTLEGNLGNALINMYVKSGHLGIAIRVFNALKRKDIISWSTVISGMAMNGHGKQALELFSLMLVHGVCLDDVVFVSLLSACSHGGLVDQGRMFFHAMRNVYRIERQIQHYACVVDMFGRAGLLEEAEAFIREMPMEPDGAVWGALLNACKVHGDDKMFERIKLGLVESSGVSTGTFALLSNNYACSNRWDDANKVRDEMRWMRLKKDVGCSWIEASLPACHP